MMELIFHDRKKKCVGDKKNLENEQHDLQQSTVLLTHDLAFLLIKSKINYKVKFSTNLILKKIDKDNFKRKKTHEKKHCSN